MIGGERVANDLSNAKSVCPWCKQSITCGEEHLPSCDLLTTPPDKLRDPIPDFYNEDQKFFWFVVCKYKSLPKNE